MEQELLPTVHVEPEATEVKKSCFISEFNRKNREKDLDEMRDFLLREDSMDYYCLMEIPRENGYFGDRRKVFLHASEDFLYNMVANVLYTLLGNEEDPKIAVKRFNSLMGYILSQDYMQENLRKVKEMEAEDEIEDPEEGMYQ